MNRIKFKLSLNEIPRFTWRVGEHFIKNNCGNLAEALAFSTILSLVPLLTIFLSILTLFESFGQFAQLAENFIFTHFLPHTSNTIQFYLHGFIHKALKFSLISLIFLWIIGIKMIFVIEEAFNAIWAVKIKRPLPSALFLYGITLVLFPLALGITAVFISYMLKFSIFSYAAHISLVREITLDILPFTLILGMFFLLYKMIPYTHVKMPCAMGGALFSTLLFFGLKNIFVWYIVHFTSYDVLYGTLSLIPIFLIWVYFMWLITLLGATLSYNLQTAY